MCMPTSAAEQKKILRVKLKKQRETLAPDLAEELSEKICQHLLALPQIQEATVIAVYRSMHHEVDITSVIKNLQGQKKTVLFPEWEEESLAMTFHEAGQEDNFPFPMQDIDVILVPGLAFDLHGDRVGYGLGYYDYFLDHLPSQVLTIGVAFGFQIVKKIPREDFDAKVKAIVTEDGASFVKSGS